MKLYQVDAFTDTPFSGNPAAVCILDRMPAEAWMQNIAREMNLAETAFLVREEDAFHLRWFTPVYEVDLCGHATLASAHTLWETGLLEPSEKAVFRTRSGQLIARMKGDQIELDFPDEAPSQQNPPPGLLAALNVEPVFTGANRMDQFVVVKDEHIVRSLQPDLFALSKVDMRGVIVTAPAENKPYDFVSRFFAPGAGVDEDPVTGSAHCCLAPYWVGRLGRNPLKAFQASARGGSLEVACHEGRVLLRGRAVTVFTAELVVQAQP